MIHADSRHAEHPLETDRSGSQHKQFVNVPFPGDSRFSFSYYTVEEGVTIDWLGHLEANDGSLWWAVADANPEILDWHDLKPGTIIRIPVV